MTGFGRAEVAGAALIVTVEARSVNHRHLDVGLRLPNALAGLDDAYSGQRAHRCALYRSGGRSDHGRGK